LVREVVANVAALRRAVELGAERNPFTVEDLLELHRILMAPVPALREGEFRSVQNWIGTSQNPAEAIHVPPPPDDVPKLVADLAEFVNRTDMSPVVQAAITHAQFEVIHPFVDGNGRVGRCLANVVLRRGARTDVLPAVSGVLLGDTAGYFAGLVEYQSGEPWSWVARFADAVTLATARTRRTVDAMEAMQARWRAAAGNPRAGSITARLIDRLPALSVADAASVAAALGVDPNVARRGLNDLESAGVLRTVAGSKRNRVWIADAVHVLLDAESMPRTIPTS
jgi:Fic family protein